MIRNLTDLFGYHLAALDGEIGRIRDFLFDDYLWIIRYAVVDTGSWLSGRRVLISPEALRRPMWEERALPVNLSRQQIAVSPPLSDDLPISRQAEMQLSQYYGWESYWLPGMSPAGPALAAIPLPPQGSIDVDFSLRSVRQVVNYHIHASDRRIGHVHDFVAETDGWCIRYLLVNTRNWLPGRKVIISPGWVHRVEWTDSVVYIDMTSEQILHSPEFTAAV